MQKLGGFVIIAFKASLSQNTFLRHHHHSCSLSLEAKTLEEYSKIFTLHYNDILEADGKMPLEQEDVKK